MPTPTGSSPYIRSAFSGVNSIDSLLSGHQWASGTISYSFPHAGSYWSQDAITGYGSLSGTSGTREPWSDNFYLLASDDMQAVRTALKSWGNVAKFSFNEVVETSTNVGDLRFAYSDRLMDQAWTYYPKEGAKGGDIWFNSLGTSAAKAWAPGSFEYLAVIHEIGHALGLKHPSDASDSPQTLPTALDSRSFTVMSYAADAGNQNTDFSFEPTTPMVLDIAAIQSLYGGNTSYNSGNNQYIFYQSGTYHQTIWDAGGIDTFVYESATGGEIDLTAGLLGGSDMGSDVYVQDSSGNNLHDVYSIYIANGVAIENATGGSGNDWIIGNRSNNVLNGRTGNDTVSYESGASSGVTVNLGLTSAQNTVGAGTDTLLAIENLMGSSFNDTFMGNTGNNVLNGGAGIDNVSYAGSSAGVSVNLGSTSAQNTVGAGIDTILGFENLIGSRFNDTLTGSGGNNTLNGGLGNDGLNGGAGIDTASYAGTASRVTVNLNSTSAQNTLGAGTDTLLAIENLVGSSFNDAFSGNASSNVLNGGLGNDWLSGGSGNDGLIGGLGNDTLTGGAGVDYFLFNTPLNGTNNKDLIADFNVTDDTIQLENNVMTSIGLSTGTLAASEFYIGTAAHDANDSIIYNKSTGALYYDADGTGASAAIQIATIGTSSHASLTNADFWVV